ncbi:tetratricopeptide repeat protein [Symbiobacterium terraclitae]|uniref:tetratricopeptide repeat protein n=1 Tax=Symbiobacterium terraclitae TaxID=557451 RepID=UPI0035B51979
MRRSRARQLSQYARFLERFLGRCDLADAYYRRALAADPDDADIRGQYAVFLETALHDYDAAEEQYLAALALAPNHPTLLGDYADFLEQSRGDWDAAERYYRRALEADPLHVNNLTNYATFLAEVRQEYDRAEALYQRTLEVAPLHRNALFKYAIFLTDVKAAYSDAADLYRVALSAYPGNAAIMANLAGALFLAGRTGAAREILRFALAHPALQRPSADAAECRFYQVVYGDPPERIPALGALRRLLDAGVRSPGFRLEPHVSAAWAGRHPWAAWLGPLAAVLTAGADIGVLDGWDAWAAARSDPIH